MKLVIHRKDKDEELEISEISISTKQLYAIKLDGSVLDIELSDKISYKVIDIQDSYRFSHCY